MSEHTPHNTADTLGITPFTLRRWCDYHAAYLSPSANPPAGQARRFTGRDLEVLKHVKSLRAQGLTVARINEQLAPLTFAEIDNSEQDTDIVEAPQDAQAAQDRTDSALAVRVALDDLEKRFDAKLEAIQQVKEPSFFVGFGAGFIAALLFVIVIVLLAVLYGGFR